MIVIGCEYVAGAIADAPCFAVQIGVTRIGRGGRVQPRTRKGAMASALNVVATTVEVIETESRPNPVRTYQDAPCARVICMLALTIVTRIVHKVIDWTRIAIGVGRVIWALIVGRPGRMHHASQPWTSIFRDGAAPIW